MASQAEILVRLNTELGDTTDSVFSADEKNEALIRAIADERVSVIAEDTNQTTVYRQRQYPLDSSYKAVFDVGIDTAGDGFPFPLGAEAYDFIAPNLNIKRRYMNLPGGCTLYITADQKLTVDDDIPAPLDNYVLELGISYCQEFLSNIKINRFLKNDTTMGELVARINLAEQRVQRMRTMLRNQRMVRL